MAGYMYLGSQKVCPAVLVGNGVAREVASYEVDNGVAKKITRQLTGDEFKGVTTIGNFGLSYVFYGTNISGNIDLSSVENVGNYGLSNSFYNTGISGNLDLSSLTTIGDSSFYYAFYGCTKLSSIMFNSITTIPNNGFSSMFSFSTASESGTCTVHFPSNMQSTISTLSGYPTFGGDSNRIILSFDLPPVS